MKSKQFDRAQAMVYADKFNLRKTEFFSQLSKLVSQYMEYDAMTVEFLRSSGAELLVTVSVKKVKPTFPSEA